MTFAAPTDPTVVSVVNHIRALRKLQKDTRVLTYKTVNTILAELKPEILATVAVELNRDGEPNNDHFSPLSLK